MYKQSKFNLYFENGGVTFLYNSHTGVFVTLNKEYQDSFEAIRNKNFKNIPDQHIEKLKEAGFIVDENTNEYQIYEYLTNKSKYSNDYLGLTIATTLQCNFRCPYCYEDHMDSYFDEDKEKNLVDFVFKNLEGKRDLSITWYGGEPLLQLDMINRVSKQLIEKCTEEKINYHFNMVSNGYLLTRNVAEHLVNENKIESVQITLDGGPKTHNMTRILRNGKGTFNKIMDNIKEICDIIKVNIRVNVSQDNIKDVHELFPILLENDLNRKVSVYFAPVTSHEGSCQSVTESCLRTEEFSKWETELINYADRLGFDMGKLYPSNLGGSVCTAVSDNTLVIDSNGNLYKCWNEVGKDHLKVGTLSDGITNNERYFNWIGWSFPNKCYDC
ncbi:radical SAM protein [Paenibacillus barengoltzii]